MRSSFQSPDRLLSGSSLKSPSPIVSLKRRKSRMITESGKMSNDLPSPTIISPASSKNYDFANVRLQTTPSYVQSPIPFLRKSIQDKNRLSTPSPEQKIPQYMMSPFPLNRFVPEQNNLNINNQLHLKIENKPRRVSNSNLLSPTGTRQTFDFQPSKLSHDDIELLLVAMKELSSLAKPPSKLNQDPLNRSLEVQRHTFAEALGRPDESPNEERHTKYTTQRSDDSIDSFMENKTPLRLAYRRKSCCCNWCGGISRLQTETENNPWIRPLPTRSQLKQSPTELSKIPLAGVRGSKRGQLTAMGSTRRLTGSRTRLSVLIKSSGVGKTEESERKDPSRGLDEENKSIKMDESHRRGTIEVTLKAIESLVEITSPSNALNNVKKSSPKKQKSVKAHNTSGKNEKPEKKQGNATEGRKKKHKMIPTKKVPQQNPDKKDTGETNPSLSPKNADQRIESGKKEPGFGNKTKGIRTAGSISSFRTETPTLMSPKYHYPGGLKDKEGKVVGNNTKNGTVLSMTKPNQSHLPEIISKDNTGKTSVSLVQSIDNIRFSTQPSNLDFRDTPFKEESKAQKKLRELMSTTGFGPSVADKKNENIKKVYMSQSTIRIKSWDFSRDQSLNRGPRESPGLGNNSKEEAKVKVNENVETEEDKLKALYERFKMFKRKTRRCKALEADNKCRKEERLIGLLVNIWFN